MDTVIFKIDRKLKQAAQKHAKNKGISLTDFYKSATQSFVDNRLNVGLIFEEPKPRPELVKEMAQISRDIKAGKNLSPAFRTVSAMRKYLEK